MMRYFYGHNLTEELKLPKGSIYRMFSKLSNLEMLEVAGQVFQKRFPPQKLYRLTAKGRGFIFVDPSEE